MQDSVQSAERCRSKMRCFQLLLFLCLGVIVGILYLAVTLRGSQLWDRNHKTPASSSSSNDFTKIGPSLGMETGAAGGGGGGSEWQQNPTMNQINTNSLELQGGDSKPSGSEAELPKVVVTEPNPTTTTEAEKSENGGNENNGSEPKPPQDSEADSSKQIGSVLSEPATGDAESKVASETGGEVGGSGIEPETPKSDAGSTTQAQPAVEPVSDSDSAATTAAAAPPTPPPTTPPTTATATTNDSEALKDTSSEVQSDVDELGDRPGFKAHPNMFSESYIPRGQPITDEARRALTEKWGAWTLVDPKLSERPKDDYFVNYPRRDIPRLQFPATAWQTDPEYLKQFLPEAQKLVRRAMEAILSEYGHGVEDEGSKSFEERAEMFEVWFSNYTSSTAIFEKRDASQKGGFMNYKGYEGLVRRVLHSIVTQDTFRVVLGGHSSAAGHGNHFQQSYTLQVQRILEPIFARLGVTMTAHNIGMGGMGTSQNAMAATDLYSNDIDVLVYDSGMTETESHVMDLFMRQGVLGGVKVPLLLAIADFGRFFKSEIFKYLGEECDADVGVFGNGWKGLPLMNKIEEADKLPWAVQYMSCAAEISAECRLQTYMSRCWIDRDDVTPPKQVPYVSGRAGWHPGNRSHQLQGRVLAFIILTAAEKALEIWSQSDGYVLDDSTWHVHEYYENIRSKVKSTNATLCQQTDMFPSRVCNVPMKGRSESTPRLNPRDTSIRSIVKTGNVVNLAKPNLYDPPDVRNPDIDACGAVDVVNIIENGVDFAPIMGRRRRRLERQKQPKIPSASSVNPSIKPGLGWGLSTLTAPDNCDGSYDSFCGRAADMNCLLSGHNDFRGGLVFDGLSGWLILNLEQLQHGLIIVKFEDWHPEKNPQTDGWTCENNECPRALRSRGADGHKEEAAATTTTTTTTRAAASAGEKATEVDFLSPIDSHNHRELKPAIPEYCKEFQFEFAIDGKITTWNLEEWQKRERKLQRVVQVWTLLDDPQFTAQPKDVELAIRMTGCQRIKTFFFTHVYWA